MSSSASAVIDLGDDDLQFTETTPPGGGTVSGGGNVGGGGTTHTFGAPDSAVDDDNDESDDRAGLLGGDKKGGNYNFWSVEFYQRFFDVDTAEVGARIKGALVPVPGKSFLSDVTRRRPDLYGPFWICATLVVSVAVTGNLASYLQAAWLNGGADFKWHYDFHKVTLAATAVFSYAWLVPAGVYGFLWWTASSALSALGLLDLLCLYGYSLAVYIPVSVLWIIQNSAVQWALVLIAAGLSGAVILLALYPVFKDGSVKGAPVLLLVILGLHLLLACGFMLYFFHVPPSLGNHNNDVEVTDNKTNETIPKSDGDEQAAKVTGNDALASKNESNAEAQAKEKDKRGVGDDEGDDAENVEDVLQDKVEAEKVESEPVAKEEVKEEVKEEAEKVENDAGEDGAEVQDAKVDEDAGDDDAEKKDTLVAAPVAGP